VQAKLALETGQDTHEGKPKHNHHDAKNAGNRLLIAHECLTQRTKKQTIGNENEAESQDEQE
jgi:hypothetical protein